MIKLRYWMVSAITVSILSLILSVVGLTKCNGAGRYFVFKQDGVLVYMIDTKTSHLFIRSINPEGKAICVDLGDLDRPQFVKNIIDLQPMNGPVSDKGQVNESEWVDIPAPNQ